MPILTKEDIEQIGTVSKTHDPFDEGRILKPLFEDWKFKCKCLSEVIDIIQNPCKAGIVSGNATKEDFLKTFHEFNEIYHDRLSELQSIWNEVEKYINELPES